PPRLIPDALAALTAMVADPGLERRGVLAVLDIGGSGTSISLAEAGSLELIGRTERFAEFAGDQIDQALLTHVLERVPHSGEDTGATAAVGSLARLREQCRSAKERLSTETEARIDVDVPGYRGEIVVTRADLESLLARPLDDVIEALRDTLQRNNTGSAALSAVVLVGGGSAIPAVRQRFSSYPGRVLWSPRPALDAAVGAALFAAFGGAAETATRAAPAVAPAGADADATYALAWSQDDPSTEDVVPYAGEDTYVIDDYADDATGRAERPNPYRLSDPQESPAEDEPVGWRRLPLSLLGVVAAIALVAVGGVAIALTSVDGSDSDRPTPGNSPLSRELTPTTAAGETVTVPGQPAAPPT
ncbi:Hsp70 family protein, partial [Mycolicibacterium obuense]